MPKRSKRYQAAAVLVDKEEYSISEAMSVVKKCATSKFDETVEVAVKLGVDAKQTEQMVRGSIVLPHGTGKKVKILVFAKPPHDKEALNAGAEYAGYQEYIDKINSGWVDFDVVVAMPDTMKEVGKLGKILGPRGLMPSPKVGTVTADIAKAVKELKAGKVEFKIDKTSNVHVTLGKASFDADKLAENVSALIDAILKARPSTAKGDYLLSATVASTMGPGVKLDLKDFKARIV